MCKTEFCTLLVIDEAQKVPDIGLNLKVLVQWQKFIESGTEEMAQENVKDLLEILVNKIKI